MKTDLEKTIVVFRLWPNGDVLALFPEIEESRGCCSSYEHVGQHGGASYIGCISQTRPATAGDYHDLALELASIGYNLKIQKRYTSKR
jgi:hypothetical protein